MKELILIIDKISDFVLHSIAEIEVKGSGGDSMIVKQYTALELASLYSYDEIAWTICWGNAIPPYLKSSYICAKDNNANFSYKFYELTNSKPLFYNSNSDYLDDDVLFSGKSLLSQENYFENINVNH